MKILFRVMLLVTLLSVAVFYLSVEALTSPVDGKSQEELVFEIKPGATLSRIAEELKEARLIRSPLLLKLYSKIRGTQSSFKVGQYVLKRDYSLYEIHNILVSGRTLLVKVTIPEGWTLSKIAALLEEDGITSKALFLENAHSSEVLTKYDIHAGSVEGFLYPDSYFLPKGYSPKLILYQMLDRFFSIIAEIYPEYRKLTADELLDRVIIASMVEKEYKIPTEAPVIAGVFYNRLKTRMPLGSCATIEYIITEELGRKHPEKLYDADLELESLYNTYIYSGLPKGPIANPGKVALKAAFYPANTDYFYFLVQDQEKGSHFFSKNLAQHNQAKKKYLK